MINQTWNNISELSDTLFSSWFGAMFRNADFLESFKTEMAFRISCPRIPQQTCVDEEVYSQVYFPE